MQLISCELLLISLYLHHKMRFVRTIPGYDHLWAVKDADKETDELSMLFRQWSNFNYLLDFFFANIEDLQAFFHIGNRMAYLTKIVL